MKPVFTCKFKSFRQPNISWETRIDPFFNVLPSVDLGTIIANVHGVGLAVRFGVIEPKADAVDWISSNEDFERLAAQGHAAQKADDDRRLAEAAARESPGGTSSEG